MIHTSSKYSSKSSAQHLLLFILSCFLASFFLRGLRELAEGVEVCISWVSVCFTSDLRVNAKKKVRSL